MLQLRSWDANEVTPRDDMPRWSFWPLSDRRMKLVAAALMFAGFAGNVNLTTSAFAQGGQQSVAECSAKCDADEKQCLDNQSSEELCDYDKKMCKKACAQQ
jgi:hypothetical protein